jgi:hypothetical protein
VALGEKIHSLGCDSMLSGWVLWKQQLQQRQIQQQKNQAAQLQAFHAQQVCCLPLFRSACKIVFVLCHGPVVHKTPKSLCNFVVLQDEVLGFRV